MNGHLAHFAINADDVEEARRFYESVFGWTFKAWGPPSFFQIEGTGLRAAALQGRRELIAGTKTVGFECTIEVDDVDRVAHAVVAGGGRILMEKTTITGVGDLIWFEDPSGNAVGAMRYDETAE
jgi:predicted enzyme related to lactoylglutathione lyase